MRRLFYNVLAIASWSSPLAADEKLDRLMQAMQLQEVIEIIGKEGREQGEVLIDTVLDGNGDSYFQAEVEDIYDPVWMHDQMIRTVGEYLNEGQIEQATVFFESELGQTIISLENSARMALMDDAIDDMARQAYRQFDRETEFYLLIDEYVHVNDLIEQNVQGSLSADYNFFLGISNSQGFPMENDLLLNQLMEQKGEVAVETESWVYSFLLLAYQPLSKAQMRENIAFSRTETGQALNEALFKGFDFMIDGIYYRLGEAVARAIDSSEL
ncbi:DUF2059 domain-containing protein [Ruegeria arenilitoris]|uniref:DUF2059 domain-containing protein n=1 Tax=Ruegeria arenilitoris TaxID=1173585 RepID=UPI00147F11A9|nr:DUF2059 domain-containing protein [Ruegeria arenilitoris]